MQIAEAFSYGAIRWVLGAHEGAVEKELGIRIEKERETVNSAEVFRAFT